MSNQDKLVISVHSAQRVLIQAINAELAQIRDEETGSANQRRAGLIEWRNLAESTFQAALNHQLESGIDRIANLINELDTATRELSSQCSENTTASQRYAHIGQLIAAVKNVWAHLL